MDKPLSERVKIEWRERPQKYGLPFWQAFVGGIMLVEINQSFLGGKGEPPFWASYWKIPQISRTRLNAEDRESAMRECESGIIAWLAKLGVGIEGPLNG